jgi:hypothetical protein
MRVGVEMVHICIRISNELSKRMKKAVKNGKYASTSHLVRESIRSKLTELEREGKP